MGIWITINNQHQIFKVSVKYLWDPSKGEVGTLEDELNKEELKQK